MDQVPAFGGIAAGKLISWENVSRLLYKQVIVNTCGPNTIICACWDFRLVDKVGSTELSVML